jgi:hypothetical protein
MKSPSFLGIAVIMLTYLAWCPADARLFGPVVPEINPSSESSLSLIGTEAINTELAKMKKIMPNDGGVAQLEDMVRAMVSIEFGKEERVAANQLINYILEKFKSDYSKAKKDVKTLDDAIDNSTQTISVTDLEGIKMKAQDWCTTKRTLETASTKLTETETALKDCTWPMDLTKCMALHIEKEHNLDALETAASDEGNSHGEFEDSVTGTASNYHAICVRHDEVHDKAARMFNNNNEIRSSMYLSMATVQCHLNGMSAQTFDIRPELVKTGESRTSTDADDCMNKLKSDASIKDNLFPDAT